MNTRGMRNNNPANIMRGSSWKGLLPFQSDKRFCQFNSMDYGIRAFFVLMRTYHYKYKLNKIGQILYRFAPLCENNTYAYIATVCKGMNDAFRKEGFIFSFDESFVINVWHNPKTPSKWLREFAKQIFLVESKYEASDEIIQKAIDLI